MMAKDESVMLRMSTETKEAIKAAATSRGKSFTTFITEAALKQARQAANREPSKGVHGGVPSFFKGCCFEAQNGGANGYQSAGWHLANALSAQSPHDLELEEWQDEVDKLKSFLAEGDGEAVWVWFKRHYPKAMKLVPTRRRDQFVVGVQRAYEDGRIEI